MNKLCSIDERINSKYSSNEKLLDLKSLIELPGLIPAYFLWLVFVPQLVRRLLYTLLPLIFFDKVP